MYLAPLIEDLKLLWESGVEYYDELFNLRVVLLWTIKDFTTYGNLSGCSVKEYKACLISGDNTSSIRLKIWEENGIPWTSKISSTQPSIPSSKEVI